MLDLVTAVWLALGLLGDAGTVATDAAARAGVPPAPRSVVVAPDAKCSLSADERPGVLCGEERESGPQR
jgi:hypothetical protein